MRNTQTPRTDAAETNWWSEDGLRSAFIVRAEFARELEREMEQLRKERDEARRIVCRMESEKRYDQARRDLPGKKIIAVKPEMVAHEFGWFCFYKEEP